MQNGKKSFNFFFHGLQFGAITAERYERVKVLKLNGYKFYCNFQF